MDLEGNEVVNLRRSHSHSLRKVPENKLQNKKHRYYFKKILEYDDEIYISPIDLNVEDGKIDIPYNPVVRVGRKLKDNKGIIILNYSVKDILEDILEIHEELVIMNYNDKTDIHLLNSEGYYLIYPDEKKEWGWMFKDRSNIKLANESGDLAKETELKERGNLNYNWGMVEYYNFNYSYVNIEEIEDNTKLTLLSVFSREKIRALRMNLLRKLVIPYIFYLVIIFLISYLYGKAKYNEKKYIEKIEELSIRDSLTKTYNKRYLFDFLKKRIEEKKRYNINFSCIMYDIDNFKQLNDRYGHIEGDETLKRLAKLVKENLRKLDILSRFGGDEFVIVLPNTDAGGAFRVTEKIRYLVEKEESLKITITLGVIESREEESLKQILVRIDELLYSGKRRGKNIVSLMD